jgi:CHASE2 domain-containing sensor protein
VLTIPSDLVNFGRGGHPGAMDHATIRSLRRWLLAATVLLAGLIGSSWAEAIDAPSSPRVWIDVALAVAALICVAVAGGRLRRQVRTSDSTGVERRTTA